MKGNPFPASVPRRFTADGEDPGVAFPLRRDGTKVDTDKPHRVKGRALPELWLDYVHQQPCLFSSPLKCSHGIEAHHFGKRGMSRKCSDFETVSLCTFHHRQFHGSGACKPLTPAATKTAFRVWHSEHLAAFLEARL